MLASILVYALIGSLRLESTKDQAGIVERLLSCVGDKLDVVLVNQALLALSDQEKMSISFPKVFIDWRKKALLKNSALIAEAYKEYGGGMWSVKKFSGCGTVDERESFLQGHAKKATQDRESGARTTASASQKTLAFLTDPLARVPSPQI